MSLMMGEGVGKAGTQTLSGPKAREGAWGELTVGGRDCPSAHFLPYLRASTQDSGNSLHPLVNCRNRMLTPQEGGRSQTLQTP